MLKKVWRGALAAPGFTIPFLLLGACAAPARIALDAAGVDRTIVPHAAGIVHAEWLGVHVMLDFAWERDGGAPPAGAYTEVFSMQRDDWSARFEAAESFAPQARHWFQQHGAELQRQFDLAVAAAHDAYPGEGGRRFRVIVLPAHTRFDGMWTVVRRGGRDLPMTFALTLPQSPRDGESMFGVIGMLFHEFSHSYFWFHPGHYRNNFSDEVVAYTEQACFADLAYPHGGPERDATALDRLADDLGKLPPDALYAKYRGKRANTELASFAARYLMAPFADMPGTDPRERAFCRSLPTAGRDFTKPAA